MGSGASTATLQEGRHVEGHCHRQNNRVGAVCGERAFSVAKERVDAVVARRRRDLLVPTGSTISPVALDGDDDSVMLANEVAHVSSR